MAQAKQNNDSLTLVCEAFQSGKVVAYPTESVFGLGCLAKDEKGLKKLRTIKNRSFEKGFIVLCADVDQMAEYFPQLMITAKQRETLLKAQEHPTTWIIPSQEPRNELLQGSNNSLAIRFIQLSTIKKICKTVGPIVSTSANKEGQKPGTKLSEIKKVFSNDIDFYYDGALGAAKTPSQIIDLKTGSFIRKA